MEKEKCKDLLNKTFRQGQRDCALVRKTLLDSVPKEKLKEAEELLGEYGKEESSLISEIEMFPKKSQEFLKKYLAKVVFDNKDVVKLLRTSGQKTWNEFVSVLVENYKELCKFMLPAIYKYEDILFLRDIDFQKMMRELDMQELANALNYSSVEIQNKVFRNISPRSGEMLKGDMDFLMRGAKRKENSEASKQKILTVLFRLVSCKDVVLNYPGK